MANQVNGGAQRRTTSRHTGRDRVLYATIVGMLIGGPLCSSTWAVADPQNNDVSSGKQLFEHRWEPHDELAGGDGLGPVFNARSCATCHPGGGASDLERNVDLVHRVASTPQELFDQIAAAQPVFAIFRNTGTARGQSTTLHRFSTNEDYQQYRENLLLHATRDPGRSTAGRRDEFMGLMLAVMRVADGKPTLLHYQRNSPALFGSGLMDSIPATAIQQAAKRKKRFGIQGRPAPVGSTTTTAGGVRRGPQSVGRFGWKGQAETLQEFVLGACANELGLAVPGIPQPRDPSHPEISAAGDDLTAQQCAQLTHFVSSLSAPRQRWPDDSEALAVARRGSEQFVSVGCAECHRERLGRVNGIYSDLLLHDMGPSLAEESASFALSYYGFADTGSVTSTKGYEWRTPPLWGVRDTGPYLHDGRAETLGEAIVEHGGEALPVVTRYLGLSPSDRLAILEFLRTLRVPDGS